MIQYSNIKGRPISEVCSAHSATSSGVLSNDLFLISQQVLSNVSPTRTYVSNGNTYINEYRSLNTSYAILSDRIFNDICGLYRIRNMAWESSAEYSPANHIHNYSKVGISTYMAPNKVGTYSVDDKKYIGLSNIATFNIDAKNYTVSMPHIQMYDEPRPYIGQLKFFVSSTFKEIDTDAGDFDGWAYPNGASLLKTRFPNAYAVFGDTYRGDDTHFKIPNLSNFLKPIAIATVTDLTTNIKDQVQYNMPLVQHSHTISQNNIKLSCKISMKYLAVGDTSNGPACHGSSSSTPNMWDTHQIAFKFKDFKINNLDCINNSGIAGEYETYPAFNYIPTLIYIGKPYNGN